MFSGTSLKGALKVFPIFGARPAENWRTTTTASIEVVGSWRYRQPTAIAVRLGARGRLVVLEAIDATALDALTAKFGPLPATTIKSISPSGKLRFWMKVVRDDVPTRLDLAPGVRLFAGGSWMRLPPAGMWMAPHAPSNSGADYMPVPFALLREVMNEIDPIPSARWF